MVLPRHAVAVQHALPAAVGRALGALHAQPGQQVWLPRDCLFAFCLHECRLLCQSLEQPDMKLIAP